MLKNWQFDVLFFVGVGGAVLFLIGPDIGLDQLGDNPLAATGIGAILTFILTQKQALIKDKKEEDNNGVR